MAHKLFKLSEYSQYTTFNKKLNEEGGNKTWRTVIRATARPSDFFTMDEHLSIAQIYRQRYGDSRVNFGSVQLDSIKEIGRVAQGKPYKIPVLFLLDTLFVDKERIIMSIQTNDRIEIATDDASGRDLPYDIPYSRKAKDSAMSDMRNPNSKSELDRLDFSQLAKLYDEDEYSKIERDISETLSISELTEEEVRSILAKHKIGPDHRFQDILGDFYEASRKLRYASGKLKEESLITCIRILSKYNRKISKSVANGDSETIEGLDYIRNYMDSLLPEY